MSGPSLQERRTPQWFFDLLVDEFGPFALDAFAEAHNALCPRYLTAADDGTRTPWIDQTFANPPFKLMGEAVRQAYNQAREGIRSIIVGPIGGSQQWLHQYAIHGTIYLLDQRLSYDLPDGTPTRGADRDSMVLAMGREHSNPDWRSGVFCVRRLSVRDALRGAA